MTTSMSDFDFAWKSIGDEESVLTLNGSNVTRDSTVAVTPEGDDAHVAATPPMTPNTHSRPVNFFIAPSRGRTRTRMTPRSVALRNEQRGAKSLVAASGGERSAPKGLAW